MHVPEMHSKYQKRIKKDSLYKTYCQFVKLGENLCLSIWVYLVYISLCYLLFIEKFWRQQSINRSLFHCNGIVLTDLWRNGWVCSEWYSGIYWHSICWSSFGSFPWRKQVNDKNFKRRGLSHTSIISNDEFPININFKH